jgi:hypothetical protein
MTWVVCWILLASRGTYCALCANQFCSLEMLYSR